MLVPSWSIRMIYALIRRQISESCPACWLLSNCCLLLFTRSISDRNLLLFEESPPLYDGLVVYQSLKQYEVLVKFVLCLMVQSPICHLFSPLVMQTVLEALPDSDRSKESQNKASLSLLGLGSLNWGRTES